MMDRPLPDGQGWIRTDTSTDADGNTVSTSQEYDAQGNPVGPLKTTQSKSKDKLDEYYTDECLEEFRGGPNPIKNVDDLMTRMETLIYPNLKMLDQLMTFALRSLNERSQTNAFRFGCV